MSFKKAAILAAGLLMGGFGVAHATTLPGSTANPLLVTTGNPSLNIDANNAASAFSGVVSINIVYDGQSFICSGTLVSAVDVVTAGHCIDTTGAGTVIDLTKAGNSVRAVFNAGSAGNGNAVINAISVTKHPDYQGFNICADGSSGCLNDDIAVIKLASAAPTNAKIYRTWSGGIDEGQAITMVGYGTSGTGQTGFTISPAFRTKRVGANAMDLFDLDDEKNFTSGATEVWYADFDGYNTRGVFEDTFCTLGLVCSAYMGAAEAGLGGGDSGGASFMKLANGEYVLVGNNTFGSNFTDQVEGTFGTYFGGMLTSGYTSFLVQATEGRIAMIPEPETYALMLAGLGIVAFSARRRKQQA